MGEVLQFPTWQELDPAEMDETMARSCLEQVRKQIKALDAQEPEDMESEAYEAWGDQHEALEDWEDDLLDRLDELQ